MKDNTSKVQQKLEEVSRLADEFGSLCEQNRSSEKQLQKSAKKLDDKLGEIVKTIEITNQTFEKQKIWYDKATSDISDVCGDLTESFEPLKNAFDEENFKALCTKIGELAHVLEECKSLRDDLLAIKSNIVEEVSKKVETEMSDIRAQQTENRKFMESNFAELFKRFESQNVQETDQ